jgi:hypothetical protein
VAEKKVPQRQGRQQIGAYTVSFESFNFETEASRSECSNPPQNLPMETKRDQLLVNNMSTLIVEAMKNQTAVNSQTLSPHKHQLKQREPFQIPSCQNGGSEPGASSPEEYRRQ